MTAGDFLAGDEPAGQEFIPEASAPRDATPPLALLYIGQTRDFPLEDGGTGLYRSIHPVDQKVDLALLTQKGKIASAPDVGLDVENLPPDDGPVFKADVERRVRAAVASLINTGDIKILEITPRRPFRGAASAFIRYQNLRDPQSKPSEITRSFSPSQ